MSSFDRLVAIPEEEYMTLSSMQNIKDPLAQHLYSLEKRYTSEENIKDPYRRLVLQSNTLDRLKQVKDELRNSLTMATPKPYVKRASALFEEIQKFLKFNDKNEIFSDDGTLVSGSRLEDLIQHAVRDRRRLGDKMPTGWPEFLKILRDHNVSKYHLNRNTLDEMDKLTIPQVTSKSDVKRSVSIKSEPEEESIRQISRSPSQKRGRRFQPTRRAKKAAAKSLEFLQTYKNE